MTKLLSLAAMFALTTASFACDAQLDEAACAARQRCEWKDNACAKKEFSCEALTDESACVARQRCEWKDNACAKKAREAQDGVNCQTRDVANCAGDDGKCALKEAEGDKAAECIAAQQTN